MSASFEFPAMACEMRKESLELKLSHFRSEEACQQSFYEDNISVHLSDISIFYFLFNIALSWGCITVRKRKDLEIFLDANISKYLCLFIKLRKKSTTLY